LLLLKVDGGSFYRLTVTIKLPQHQKAGGTSRRVVNPSGEQILRRLCGENDEAKQDAMERARSSGKVSSTGLSSSSIRRW